MDADDRFFTALDTEDEIRKLLEDSGNFSKCTTDPEIYQTIFNSWKSGALPPIEEKGPEINPGPD